MNIVRNGVTITLTPEEMEAAYREQLRAYRRENARRYVMIFAGINPECQTDGEIEENAQAFLKARGTDPRTIIGDDETALGLLDLIVDAYEDAAEDNLDPERLWELAIETAFPAKD